MFDSVLNALLYDASYSKHLCIRYFEVPIISAIQNETTAAAFNLPDEVHLITETIEND